MIDAWIVVREEKHISDKFWICLEREDALHIATDLIKYWRDQYKIDTELVDETCYEDLILHFAAEDAFRIFVQPQCIREIGEIESLTE